MTSRSLRRAAERKARKEARKQVADTTSLLPSQPELAESDLAEVAIPAPPSHPSPARLAANRANAQLSTGPSSSKGKAASSQNNLRHGLAGAFKVLLSEEQAQFDQLVAALREEHQPSSPTEDILVSRMAEHHWLSRRAQRFQNNVLEPSPNHADSSLDRAQCQQLSLFLRYQTTNDRAFFKALNELTKLRAARLKEERGFESQKLRQQTDEARVRLANARAETLEDETDFKRMVQAPFPGHTVIPYDRVKQVVEDGFRRVAREMTASAAA